MASLLGRSRRARGQGKLAVMKTFIFALLASVAAFANPLTHDLQTAVAKLDQRIVDDYEVVFGEQAKLWLASAQFQEKMQRSEQSLGYQIGILAGVNDPIYEVNFQGWRVVDGDKVDRAKRDVVAAFRERSGLIEQLKGVDSIAAIHAQLRGANLEIMYEQALIAAQETRLNEARAAFQRVQADHNKKFSVQAGFQKPIYDMEFQPWRNYDADAVKAAKAKIAAFEARKAELLEGLVVRTCEDIFSRRLVSSN